MGQLQKREAIAGFCARFDDREAFELRMLPRADSAHPVRPLAFYFGFIEVGITSGQVSSCLAALGRFAGPVLCPRFSPVYNLADPRVIEWVLFLLHHRRIKCIMLAPAVLRPSRRDARGVGFAHFPGSWRTSAPRCQLKIRLVAHRCLLLLFAAARCNVLARLLQVGSSVLPCLPVWHRVVHFGFAQLDFCPCAFEGTCRRDCKLLAFGIDLSTLALPCCRGYFASGRSSEPAGRFLPPLLARAVATEIDRALRRVTNALPSVLKASRAPSSMTLFCPCAGDQVMLGVGGPQPTSTYSRLPRFSGC